MKASHFTIGKVSMDSANYTPAIPELHTQDSGDKFSVADAKKRLGQASWTLGHSPMKY